MQAANVLDHGFVRLLNVAGPVRGHEASVRDIAKAARVSFANYGQEREFADDVKLAKYLWRHEHMSPFEMIETWWEIKAPIFVARQWVRHRTAGTNEISGRYVKLPEEWYIPTVVGGKPVANKQGRSEGLDKSVQEDFKDQLNKACEESYILYQNAIENGVAPEHARMALHQNHYTQWLWKMDLRNLLHFLRLRTDSHAQWEIRQYAATMQDMIYSNIDGLKEVIEQ